MFSRETCVGIEIRPIFLTSLSINDTLYRRVCACRPRNDAVRDNSHRPSFVSERPAELRPDVRVGRDDRRTEPVTPEA